jgi:hypothetical protein
MNQPPVPRRRQDTSQEAGEHGSPTSLQKEHDMAEHSRRAFIRGAGVTAAAATVAVMAPGVASAASKSESDDGSAAPNGSVVAYVKDAKSGNITVMRGEREVQVTDKALARKLAKLTQV